MRPLRALVRYARQRFQADDAREGWQILGLLILVITVSLPLDVSGLTDGLPFPLRLIHGLAVGMAYSVAFNEAWPEYGHPNGRPQPTTE